MQYDQRGFIAAPDGVSLFYGVAGPADAPALILNDGIGCDGFAWEYLLPAFADRYRVIHWNYRGHGRSGAPVGMSADPRLTPEAIAEDLVTVMDGLEVESALLFGHSMGTQIELEAYRRVPERVTAMVLLCGSYGRVTHTFRGTDILDRALPGMLATVQSNSGLARGLWSRVSPDMAYRIGTLSGEIKKNLFKKDDFRRYWEHIGLMDPDVFLTLLGAAGEHSAEDLLADINVPTLVIAAEFDTFTPVSLAEQMAAAIPAAEYFLLRGASHGAPVEYPEAIQHRIEKFLRERLP